MFGPPFSPSVARIVDHIATAGNAIPVLDQPCFAKSGPASLARAVGHKPVPVPEMVRTRARGFNRDCPHGVAQGFQITSHKSEPLSSGRNLLAKDCCRAALLDEPVPGRPKVPLVSKPAAAACRAERLARTASRPNLAMIGPSRAA
jgi:hypothetical protein